MAEESVLNFSHRAIRNNYDRLSRWYDLIESGWERKPRELGLNLFSLQPGNRVLEIGCGTGLSLASIASQVAPDGSTVGIDLSFGMLSVARDRTREDNLTGSTGLIQADALWLPLPGELFDAIFMSFTLELFIQNEMTLLLAECRRLLTREGKLCVVATSSMAGNPWMTKVYQWFHRVLPHVVDCQPIQAARILQEAGFQILSSDCFSKTGIGIEIVLAGL